MVLTSSLKSGISTNSHPNLFQQNQTDNQYFWRRSKLYMKMRGGTISPSSSYSNINMKGNDIKNYSSKPKVSWKFVIILFAASLVAFLGLRNSEEMTPKYLRFNQQPTGLYGTITNHSVLYHFF